MHFAKFPLFVQMEQNFHFKPHVKMQDSVQDSQKQKAPGKRTAPYTCREQNNASVFKQEWEAEWTG